MTEIINVEKKNIHLKLLQFQKTIQPLKKDGQNPHFHSRYVTLNEVLDKVKKPLNDMGVLILQQSDAHGLTTTLYDTETDTFVSSYLPYVEVTTAQKLGSNNTYNRRYALVTMLGLEDEDDDGNEASFSTGKKTDARPITVTNNLKT